MQRDRESCWRCIELSKLTGSRAYERYMGPQIRKLYKTKQDIYNETERISFVSSFMACFSVGGYASIDETDATRINLMDIREREHTHILPGKILEPVAPFAASAITVFVARITLVCGETPSSLLCISVWV